jgi:hypothetical protein
MSSIGRRRMTEMTPEEREHFDARADKEAWSYALSILSPWVEATRLIGSDELTRVMESALAEAEQEVARALVVLASLEHGEV